mgnify:CR=1 FL=1
MANILFWMLLISVVSNVVLFNVKQQWKEEYYACLRDALQMNADTAVSAVRSNIKNIKESNNETI